MRRARQVGGSARCDRVTLRPTVVMQVIRHRAHWRNGHGDTGSRDRDPARRRLEQQEHGGIRHRRHRRWPGRTCRRLLPEEARPVVRDPGRERPNRRILAHSNLEFAAPLHPGSLRRVARLGLSRSGLVVSDRERVGRLPRGLCAAVRASRAKRDGSEASREGRRALCRGLRRAPLRGRQCGRRDRLLRDAVGTGLRVRARSAHRADAFQRVPRSVPASARRRPPRRRRKLGRGHRDGSVGHPPDLALRERQRSDPVRISSTRSGAWSCRCSGSSPRTS